MNVFFPTRLFASFLYPGGERAVYVMERIFGQTLGDHLLEQFLNEMDDVWVRFFLSQIMSAVSFMHCAGIVHRDLKSDNIMVRYPDRKVRKRNLFLLHLYTNKVYLLQLYKDT